MRLLVFPQYAKLIAHFRAVASTCAAEKARWPICRVEAQNGVAHLHDHAMNVLALTGGTTTIILPDIIPGKARQFRLRLSATGENTISFVGAPLESADDDAFAPPLDFRRGQTPLYAFSRAIQTSAGVRPRYMPFPAPFRRGICYTSEP